MSAIIQLPPTEYQEHVALMKWIATQPNIRDIFIHIPNEGKRNPISGAHLKRMGMRKGVSDFFLPKPNKESHGLWVELKRTKGARETPEQKDWINKMKALNYDAHFAYGWEHAREIILHYLN